LRFPEFEGEWETRAFSDIGTFFKGIGISKEQLTEEGTPCILYGELYTKYKNEVIKEVKSKTSINTNGLVFSKANDVIIPSSGESAIDISTACCVTLDNILLGGDLNVIRPKKHNGSFISYQLNGKRKYDIAKIAQGSSIIHLYNDSLNKIKINVPRDIKEEDKIVVMLSLLDDRISTQIQIIEGLETLIKNLNNNLKELYGNEIEISLQQIGTFYSGLSGKSAEDFGRGKPFITYMNVYKNIIVDESMVQYVNIDKNESQNKVQYGDVLFTLSSETPQEVGMSAIYLGNNNELYLNSFCLGYRLNNFDTLLPEYMPYLFSCKQFRKIVSPLAQGSTRFNLQKTDFLNKKFKIPTIQNQKKISNILNALSEKLKIEQNLLSEYQNQKKYLLNQMFI